VNNININTNPSFLGDADGASRDLAAALRTIAELAAETAIARAESRRRTPTDETTWRLLTLNEAAAALTRSPRWLRERVSRGELPVIRLDGGALSFQLEDLEAFVNARRVPSCDDARRNER
jgi:Helix-turn-helix domain